ncbi:MAG: tRNA 2-selenouridine(34) synthase MnmH [Gammaproteobacteria bacterium]|nr:tRNA 2-selenouridine(34) synthase MnmH [Gammaproteobacteria bacterium]MYJ75723.1 tRNA 2-selenouridine(34) synthase MnmH [Gammaproteobacteria bacterium]
MSLPAIHDHARILREGCPLIDVRSPTEYRRGTVPGAVNLPILDDDERDAVGKTYKQRGSEAAIALGHQLVSGATKASRIAAWQDFAGAHPDAAITCWRGGLRSAIAQQWLADAGTDVARVAGGFKALRHFCLETIQSAGASRRFVLVGGRTGSGKTRVVRAVPAHIDLEAHANHRGSAFGGMPTPQPTPVTFENALAVALLKQPPNATIALEDESRTIGRLALPEALYNAMQQAPIALLTVDDDVRIANIYEEYVIDADDPQHHLRAGLSRIERRLGGVRYREIAALMDAAFKADAAHRRNAHREWIKRLLEYYYDPMYDYQLAGKKDRIAMRGAAAEVADHLRACRGAPTFP